MDEKQANSYLLAFCFILKLNILAFLHNTKQTNAKQAAQVRPISLDQREISKHTMHISWRSIVTLAQSLDKGDILIINKRN